MFFKHIKNNRFLKCDLYTFFKVFGCLGIIIIVFSIPTLRAHVLPCAVCIGVKTTRALVPSFWAIAFAAVTSPTVRYLSLALLGWCHKIGSYFNWLTTTNHIMSYYVLLQFCRCTGWFLKNYRQKEGSCVKVLVCTTSDLTNCTTIWIPTNKKNIQKKWVHGLLPSSNHLEHGEDGEAIYKYWHDMWHGIFKDSTYIWFLENDELRAQIPKQTTCHRVIVVGVTWTITWVFSSALP